jgi:hypothetical protein
MQSSFQRRGRRFQKKQAAADAGVVGASAANVDASLPGPSSSSSSSSLDAVAPRVDVAAPVAGTRPGLHGQTLVSTGLAGPRQPARRRSTARHRHDARHRRRPILRRGERVHPPAILRRGGMRQRARRDVDTPRGGRREEHRALAPARRRRQVPSRRRRNRNAKTKRAKQETPTTAFASRGSTGGTCGRARRSTTAGWAAKGTAWARGCPHPAERTRRRGWTRTRDGKTTAG